jgi:hypothetical protein
MVPKPQRTILNKVSGYAEEAAAYMRRRRITRTPFARVHYHGGRAVAYPSDTDAGRALFRAAANVIDVARVGEAETG